MKLYLHLTVQFPSTRIIFLKHNYQHVMSHSKTFNASYCLHIKSKSLSPAFLSYAYCRCFNSQLPCVCPFLVKKRVRVSKRAKYSYLPVGILLKSKGPVTTQPPSEVTYSFPRTHCISASPNPPRPHSALQGPLCCHSDLPKGKGPGLSSLILLMHAVHCHP